MYRECELKNDYSENIEFQGSVCSKCKEQCLKDFSSKEIYHIAFGLARIFYSKYQDFEGTPNAANLISIISKNDEALVFEGKDYEIIKNACNIAYSGPESYVWHNSSFPGEGTGWEKRTLYQILSEKITGNCKRFKSPISELEHKIKTQPQQLEINNVLEMPIEIPKKRRVIKKVEVC